MLTKLENMQAVLRSYRDQMCSEAMAYLHERGEEWTEGVDRLTLEMMESPDVEEPMRTIGKLAQIGFLTVFGEAVVGMENP